LQIEPLEAAYDAHLYHPEFFVGTGGPLTSYFLDFVISRRRVWEEEKKEEEREREREREKDDDESWGIRC